MRQCPKCRRRFTSTERVCPDDGSLLDETGSTEEAAIGKTLDGKYRIDGFLKRGGMGAVYRGTHVMLKKPVAIKLIKPELVTSREIVERFLREARSAAQLSHPNIVTIHDLGQTADGTLYIAMELVPGESLKELVQREGPWEPRRAVRLAKGIASALALAHEKGTVHRDLKPQNIMVHRDSDGNETPKLLDFGIAKTLEPDSPALTQTGMVLGTPHYMSSEQAKGQEADGRSDLYALGIILYEMLVGKVPFDDKSIPSILIKHLNEPPLPPSTLKGDIPKDLEAIVLRCLEKDPSRRFQTATELMGALDDVSDTAVQTAIEPTVAATAVSTSTHTMAGAASAALPSMPEASTRQETGTVRARDLRAREPKRSKTLLWVGLAALVVLAVLLFLRRRASVRESTATIAESTPPASVATTAPAVTSPAMEDTPDPSDTGPVVVETTTSTAATSAAPPAAPPRQTAQLAPPPPATTSAAEPLPPPLPARPPVHVSCQGLRDGCAAMRATLAQELRGRDIPLVRRPRRAEILLELELEELESRTEEQFGTSFVVRTYSVTMRGEVPRFEDEMTPPPKTFSFDARFGREKLMEQSRLIASGLADRIEAYWASKR